MQTLLLATSVDTANIQLLCTADGALDRDLMREMLQLFVEDNMLRLSDAFAALNHGNRVGLTHAAHAIKGSAAMVGASYLRDIAHTIEARATSETLQALVPLVERLGTEMASVVATLRLLHPGCVAEPRERHAMSAPGWAGSPGVVASAAIA